MSTPAQRFMALHRPGDPLLMPNAWDAGSARMLESLGFQAIATTSGGHAATLGRRDGAVSRAEALEHAAALAGAVSIPVSADLEDCFASDSGGVAETVRLAAQTGLAGCSIEDYDGDAVLALEQAVERVQAAAEAAHGGPVRLVLTARAENHLRGRDDLDDTIVRLRAYGEAGADVLYAPGLREPDQISRVVAEVGRPVNVLAWPGLPPVPELAALGISRVSVGSAFAFAALGTLAEAARELRETGTYGFFDATAIGARAARSAFSSP